MNNYQYYVNGKPVSRKEMIVELKNKCYKIIRTEYIGDIGINTTETDEKKFNSFIMSRTPVTLVMGWWRIENIRSSVENYRQER